MSNGLIKDILQEYEQQRDVNKRLLETRQQEIYEKIPEFEQIQKKIILFMVEQSRSILQSPESTEEIISDTNQKLLSLQARQRELLHEHGFPMDYLELSYSCPRCKDTGYVGDVIREKCNCLIQRLLQRAYQLSNIKELESQNFDTFDISVFHDEIPEGSKMSQRDYMERVRALCVKYAEEFPNTNKPNLVFSGKTGLGKTFLLNCVAKAVLDGGYTVLKLTAYKLFDTLFRYHTENRRSGMPEVDLLFQVDLLIIDDLGIEPMMNNVTVEYLFSVLNERLLNKRHTLVSTNLSPKEILLRYSERISSRLLDTSSTTVIRFTGRDVRLNR